MKATTATADNWHSTLTHKHHDSPFIRATPAPPTPSTIADSHLGQRWRNEDRIAAAFNYDIKIK